MLITQHGPGTTSEGPGLLRAYPRWTKCSSFLFLCSCLHIFALTFHSQQRNLIFRIFEKKKNRILSVYHIIMYDQVIMNHAKDTSLRDMLDLVRWYSHRSFLSLIHFSPQPFFSCPGSSIPDLGHWLTQSLTHSVTDCHFRILTQRVTFDTWHPSDMSGQKYSKTKRQKDKMTKRQHDKKTKKDKKKQWKDKKTKRQKVKKTKR